MQTVLAGKAMKEIKLDPRKLLGFKIVADGNSVVKLHSPKIGTKGCTVTDADAVQPADTRVPRIQLRSES
jgi:hypothetical protein